MSCQKLLTSFSLVINVQTELAGDALWMPLPFVSLDPRERAEITYRREASSLCDRGQIANCPQDAAYGELIAAKIPALSCPERLLMKRLLVENNLFVGVHSSQEGWSENAHPIQWECHFTGSVTRACSRLTVPWSRQVACSPMSPCALGHPNGDRSPHLPNPDAAERHIWSVYSGNKKFLIPWQRDCLQNPHSNRAVFIEFLCTECTHAWDFNSFITEKHLVLFLSEVLDENYYIFVWILVCLDQDLAKFKYVGLQRFPRQRDLGGGKSLLPSGLFCEKVCHKISDME